MNKYPQIPTFYGLPLAAVVKCFDVLFYIFLTLRNCLKNISSMEFSFISSTSSSWMPYHCQGDSVFQFPAIVNKFLQAVNIRLNMHLAGNYCSLLSHIC